MRLFKILLRPSCVLCRLEPASTMHALCEGCYGDLPWRRTQLLKDQMPIDVAWDYAWPIDRLIQQFKYQQRLEVLPILRTAFAASAPQGYDAIVPIPMSTTRLQQRGMNHAQLLAQTASRVWQIPLWSGLIRPQDTARQQSLDRLDRLHNLAHAFRCQATPPARLLLIDDVLTTGATLLAARQCLQQAGARQIDAWVLASAQA